MSQEAWGHGAGARDTKLIELFGGGWARHIQKELFNMHPKVKANRGYFRYWKDCMQTQLKLDQAKMGQGDITTFYH